MGKQEQEQERQRVSHGSKSELFGGGRKGGDGGGGWAGSNVKSGSERPRAIAGVSSNKEGRQRQ